MTSCQRKIRPTTLYGYSIPEPKAIKYGGLNAIVIYNPCMGRPNYDGWSFPRGWDDFVQVSNGNGNVGKYIELINKKGGIYIYDSHPIRYDKTKIKVPACGYYFERDDKLVLVAITDLPSFMIGSEEEETFLVNVTNNDKPLQSRILLQYEDRKELEAYNEANRRNTVQGCREFLAKYPNSKYKNNVNGLIATLEPIETAKREAEIAAAKREEERKKAIILEKGADFVVSKGVMGKYRVFNGLPTGGKSIEFADGTSGSIYDIDGYYSIAEIMPSRTSLIRYENEEYAIKALYKYAKGLGISSEGRYYGSVSSNSSSFSSSSRSSSSSSSESEDEKYEKIEHPGVDESSNWEEDRTPYDGKFFWSDIKFEDGVSGRLYRGGDSGNHFIENSGGANYYYKDYNSALRALYVYKKHNVFIKRGSL